MSTQVAHGTATRLRLRLLPGGTATVGALLEGPYAGPDMAKFSTVPGRALAIYAHPDDPDVACGGTFARWAAGGGEVFVCICAEGDKGSTDPSTDPRALARLRRDEVAAAGKHLGVSEYRWFDYPDGEVDSDGDLRSRLVALIRELRPDTVVAPDPTAVYFGPHYINHRDHRAVGWAVLDAVAPAAGNPHYFPDAGAAHRVNTLLLSGTLDADCWVDVGATIGKKAAAVACHRSQVGDDDSWLATVVRERASEAGAGAGLSYAEGYRRVSFA